MTSYGEIAWVINGFGGPQGPTQLHRSIYFPLRREGRMLSAGPVCSCAHFLCTLHTRPQVQRAPGLPCALCLTGGKEFQAKLGRIAPRECRVILIGHRTAPVLDLIGDDRATQY